MNRFPADDEGDFSDLRKRVDELEALLKNRAPLTEVSKGWVMRSMDSPDTGPLGPDDIHIYPSGGKLWVASQGSDIALGEISFGPSVDDPPAQTATPLPSGQTVLGSDYNKMGADLDAVWQVVVALNAVLRGGQFPS